MTASYAPSQGQRRRVYRCRRRHAHGDCPAPAQAPELELLELVEPVFWETLSADAEAHALRDDAKDGERLQADVERAERSLKAFMGTDFDGIDATFIADGARAQQEHLDAARNALADWQRATQTEALDVPSLRTAWPDLRPRQRGELLAALIGAVVVRAPDMRRRGYSAPLDGRVNVVLVDDLPADLPRQGRRVAALRSFGDVATAWLPLAESGRADSIR
jgi:hypothetical protein